jgi:hypothetical protein
VKNIESFRKKIKNHSKKTNKKTENPKNPTGLVFLPGVCQPWSPLNEMQGQ